MDKQKEEQSDNSSPLKETEAPGTLATTTPNTDDESVITTSTESDTPEAWTLVTDRKSKRSVNKFKDKEEKDRKEDEEDQEAQIDHDNVDEVDEPRVEILEHRPENNEADKTLKYKSYAEAVEACEEDRAGPISGGPHSSESLLNDDLSDGISIISESESAGRISPHPDLREHFSNLHFKFLSEDIHGMREHLMPDTSKLPVTTGTPITISSSDVNHSFHAQAPDALLRHRTRQLRRPVDEDSFAADDERSMSTKQCASALQPVDKSLSRFVLPSVVKGGLTGIFYVCVALALLGFVGKLQNPDWQPWMPSERKSVEAMEQKLTDMELQNNLMRAEIDLLSKQVNYLSSMKEKGKGGKEARPPTPPTPASSKDSHQRWEHENYKKNSKTFKAWSGNGDSLQAEEITKSDLKRPYQCPDGRFVEVAGMCVENKPIVEPIIEEVNKVLQDAKLHDPLLATILDNDEEKTTQEDKNEIPQTPPPPSSSDMPFKAEDNLKPKEWPAQRKGDQQRPSTPDYQNEPQQPKRKCYDPKKCQMRGESSAQEEGIESKHRYYGKKNSKESKEARRDKKHKDKSKESKSNEKFRRSHGDKSKEQNSNERFRRSHEIYKADTDNLRENHHSREHFNKPAYKVDKEDWDTRERGKSSKSREHSHKNERPKYEQHSYERQDSKEQRRRFSNSKERFESHGDGEWHEKLMRHREQARQHNDRARNEGNWYINRGNSREQMRHR